MKNSTASVFASLAAQMAKSSPAMQETRVRSLGREDPLEKGVAIRSSIVAWRIPWTGFQKESDTTQRLLHPFLNVKICLLLLSY